MRSACCASRVQRMTSRPPSRAMIVASVVPHDPAWRTATVMGLRAEPWLDAARDALDVRQMTDVHDRAGDEDEGERRPMERHPARRAEEQVAEEGADHRRERADRHHARDGEREREE